VQDPTSHLDQPPTYQRFGLLLLIAAILLVYLPAAVNGSFLWDDGYWLWENAIIKASAGWQHYWVQSKEPDYYPITSTWFYLQWQLFQRDPLGYHLINLALHITAAVLLWRVFIRINLVPTAAFFAALLFALHPLSVTSVMWITEQKNTLSMVFYLAAMLAYLRHERDNSQPIYILAIVLYLIGMLSKASGAPLPLVLLLIAWHRRGRIDRQDLKRIAPFFVIAIVLGAVAIYFQQNHAITGEYTRPEAMPSRIAVAGLAVWFYLAKAIAPFNTMMIYPRWTINPSNPLVYVPTLLLLLPIIAFTKNLQKTQTEKSKNKGNPRRAPLQWAALTALLSFILLLAPILGLINMSFHRFSLVADHWTYHALPALIALITAAIVHFCKKQQTQIAILLLITTVFAILTAQRAHLYADPATLWQDNINRNPQCWAAMNNYAIQILEQNPAADPAPLIKHFRRAIEINPDYAVAHRNLGRLFARDGNFKEGIPLLLKAVQLRDSSDENHKQLGLALAQSGQIEKAIAHLARAFKIDSYDVETRLALGQAFQKLQRYESAISWYQDALLLTPDDPGIYYLMSQCFIELDQKLQAIEALNQAIIIANKLGAQQMAQELQVEVQKMKNQKSQ